jgi:hypothetical protein
VTSLALVAALVAAPAPPAPAAPPPPPPSAAPDASYGRIDGDMSVVAGAGVTLAPRGVRGTADLRLRYLDTIGVWGSYEDAAVFSSGSDPKRLVAFGLELRPLFLARWLKGRELGWDRVDLAIDSLGVEIGPYFSQPVGGSFGDRPGLQLGGGLELPLLRGASGPWIGVHGGVRWSDAAIGGAALRGPADRAAFLSVTLAWHQFFGAHAVDVGDRER